VNAAFLLVTTAWLTGADPVAPPPVAPAMKPAMVAPGAPPVMAAPMAAEGCSSCGDSAPCGSGCSESVGHRLRGLFACHKKSCGCETSAPAPAPTCCAPAPAPTCSTCATHHESCGCGSLGGRLKGLFHRKSCCETVAADCGGCATCGDAPAPMMAPAPGPVAPRPVEPIPAPGPGKKMPNAPKTTLFNSPESIPVPVSTPALETAPAVVPNVPANTDRKEPF